MQQKGVVRSFLFKQAFTRAVVRSTKRFEALFFQTKASNCLIIEPFTGNVSIKDDELLKITQALLNKKIEKFERFFNLFQFTSDNNLKKKEKLHVSITKSIAVNDCTLVGLTRVASALSQK